MIALILTIHLALAAIYTVSIALLAGAAFFRKSAQTIQTSAISSFAVTIMSGGVLVAVSPKAMAQFCASTLMASVFGVVACALYKHRVTASQAVQSTVY